MQLRRGALCAAAGRSTEGLLATVGRIAPQPGAASVIAGDVVQPFGGYWTEHKEIGGHRQVGTAWHVLRDSPAVPCAPGLASLFAQAIEELGFRAEYLASGAVHDAVPMAAPTDVAMLFVRCKESISHNPAESVTIEDVVSPSTC